MTEKKELNYFEELNAIDVSDKVEKKNNLSYLSWAWAWAELKKRYPMAKKEVIKNDDGWLYHTDGKTCWVEVKVNVRDIEETEYLPVMDYRNQAIPLDKVTSMNVNTTIQRAVTKAIARHGLGLYVYAGEDLPESDNIKEKIAQSADEDMKATFEKSGEDNFNKIKNKLEGCGSAAEVEETWSLVAKVINGFKKYDNKRYTLLVACKDTMKANLDPDNEEA